MASISFVGVSKLTPTAFFTRLCKVPKNHNAMQVAFMKRLALCEPVDKPPCFKYWEKPATIFQMAKTRCIMRYDDNTRLIVVDGPPAVGKTKVCEKLAEEFGLLYMPAPVHDDLYKNVHGYDLRDLDSKLPLDVQSYDLERFLANPNDIRVTFFQTTYLQMRFEQYANALLHVLSTGQGVVLNRCIYSDVVFMEAMLKSDYVSKKAMSEYMYMKERGCAKLYRPHLVIYLDAPPEVVKEKIKRRGNPHEVNSKVFTTKFLTDLENAYKEKYLKPLRDHSELLIYDWSNEGNIMDIVHDIEQADLDTYQKPRLADWIFHSTTEIYNAIDLFQKKMPIVLDMYENMEIPPRECYWTADEYHILESELENIPTEKYDVGYIPQVDKVLFSGATKLRLNHLRRSSRDLVNLNKALL